MFNFHHKLVILVIDYAFVDPLGEHVDIQSYQFLEDVFVYVQDESVSGFVDKFLDAGYELTRMEIFCLIEEITKGSHYFEGILDLDPHILEAESV